MYKLEGGGKTFAAELQPIIRPIDETNEEIVTQSLRKCKYYVFSELKSILCRHATLHAAESVSRSCLRQHEQELLTTERLITRRQCQCIASGCFNHAVWQSGGDCLHERGYVMRRECSYLGIFSRYIQRKAFFREQMATIHFSSS